MDTYGANNLLEELNGLANEGEHPAVREILSNIILLSTPNHPGQAEFIKTPETFVQKRSEIFIHIVQNMHLLSEEEKTHVRDFIRGAYFYGDEIQNTGRKREITKRVLDEILKTIGLPKLLEAMHFFDSMDSYDSYIERNMFANHVRESYKKLQQEQRTSATVVAIDEDTKGELEFRLTTYFMRANSAENEEQRKFYGTLWALADSKLNPQKYKLTQAEINAAPSGLIQNLEKTRPSFSGQSLVDAGSFIRGVLLPSERANPHYVVNHQTYDMLEPSTLFRTSYLYGARNVLEGAIETLPPKFAIAYPDWKVVNSDFIAQMSRINNSGGVTELEKMTSASEPQGINFIELKRQYKESSDIATSANIKRLYALMMKFNDDALNKKGWKYTPETQKELSDILSITVNNFNEFTDSNRKHVREFIELLLLDDESADDRNVKFDRNAFAITFSTLVNPIKKDVLFGALRNVGLEERLQKIITDNPALKPILRAYDNWKTSPQAKVMVPTIDVVPDIKAEPVTLEAQGRAAELMVLRAQYEMRANEISTQEQKVFYYSLMILCERALGVKESKEYQFKNLDDKDLDVSTPEKLSIAVLASLGTRKSKLDQQAQKDAKEFVHGFLIARNPDVDHAPLPFISATDAFYDAIPPEFLFELAYDYDELYCFSAPNMGLPENIMSAYAKWRHIHGQTVAENDVTKLELAQRGLSDAQANDDKVKIHFYEFLIEEQSLFSGAERDGSYNQKREELIKIKAPQFISWALKNFVEFSEDERWMINTQLLGGALSIPPKIKVDALEGRDIVSHVNPITDLFHLAYLVDAQESLHKMIGGQHYPKLILKAYREWKDTPQAIAFKAACKAGQTDKAWEMLQIDESTKPEEIVPEGTEVISLTGDTSIDEMQQELRNTIQGFKEKSAATDDELAKKLYALIISLLDFEEAYKHVNEKDWEIKSNIRFILFVAEKGEKLSLEDRLQAREQMRAYVDKALFPKNPDWEKAHIKILRGVPSFMLFRAVHICDLQDKFIDCMNEKLVPVDIRIAYNQWKKVLNNQAFIADCEARNNPPTSIGADNNPEENTYTAAVAPSDARLTIIRVEHALVVQGNKTNTMGFSAVDGKPNDKPHRQNKVDQNRTEELYTALFTIIKSQDTQVELGSKNPRMKSIKVYEDVRPESGGDKISSPYNVIDIEMTDGTHTHIVVCDFLGHMTYVERAAGEYDDTQIKDIENLRKSDKVWTIPYATKKQWLEGVQELINKPFDELSREVKYRSYWKTLYEPAADAFARAVMMTGKPPAKDRETIINVGDIETTPARLLDAAYRGAMEGMPKKTTPTQLFNMIANGTNDSYPDVKYQWLHQFQNRPQITAEQILNAVEEYNRVMGEVDPLKPDNYCLADIDLPHTNRRTLVHANIALKFGAVSIPNSLIPEGSNPRNLVEFLELVEQKKSSIVPECRAA